MTTLACFIGLVIVLLCQPLSASEIDLQANPSKILPVLTKTFKLRCAITNSGLPRHRRQVLPTATQATIVESLTHSLILGEFFNANSPTQQAGPASTAHTTTPASSLDISHVISIIISKQDPTTGILRTLATLSSYDPPLTSTDSGNLKVEGSTDSSPVSWEQAYLQLTWDYPTEAESGTYFCDVYSMDYTFHPVSLTRSLVVSISDITASELATLVIENEKLISEMTQEFNTKFEALNSSSGAIKGIEIGNFTCHGNNYSGRVSFHQLFQNTPQVFLSAFDFQWSFNTGGSYSLKIDSIDRSGFNVVCSLISSAVIRDVQWLAVDTVE